MKKPATATKKHLKKLANNLDALTARRLSLVGVLLKLKHPIIAAHLLLPGLFIGLVGGASLITAVNHDNNAHAAGANLWLSTTGNDTTCVRGDQTKPCLSMNKAYAIAQCGDVVSVASGTYTTQTITNSKACTSSTPVKFVAESGQPIFDKVNVNASYVWIEGMKVPHSLTSTSVGFWNVEAPEPGNLPSAVSYVTLKNDEGGGLYIFAEHVDVLGGSYGGFSACLTGQEDLTRIWQENIATSGEDYRASSYVTIDGVTIHDGTDNGNKCGDAVNGPHVDAMQILGGHYVTIRNSNYYNCPTSCIIGSGFRTGEDNYLIENNFFQEEANPGATLNFSYSSSGDPDTGANMVIRYNTTNGTISTGCTASSPSCWKVYGNVTAMASCNNGAVWTYNAVSNGICTGGGGKACTPAFVGPTPQSSYGSSTIPDFRLSSSDTCARDVIPTSAGAYPLADKFGTARPQGPSLDMGAFEFGTGSTPPPPPSDTTPPTVSLTAPTNGASITGTTMLSATASDNVAVTSVQFKVDGTLVATGNTSPYSYSWDSGSVANGTHTITAVASDAAGNSSTSGSATVTVSNTNIKFGESNVLTNADNGNANLLLAQSANLSTSGTLKSLSFYVTNAAGKLRLGLYGNASGAPGAKLAETAEITPVVGWNTATVTTPVSITAGTYWLAYLPSDNNLAFVKNTDTSSSGKFYNYTYGTMPATFATTTTSTTSHWSFYGTLDTTPVGDTTAPSVSWAVPANGANISGVLSEANNNCKINASDNVGVDHVNVYFDGALINTELSAPYTCDLNTSTVAAGSHTLKATAYDKAGNSTSASITVTVDGQPPTVSLTAPLSGATVSGSAVSITASASDNVGVAGVQFQLDCPGTACGNLGAEDTTSPYSFTWDTTTLANGTHTITAVARDSAGNISTTTITVTVNNTVQPPQDTIAPSVPTGLVVKSKTTNSISISWSPSTDNAGGTGVAGYRIYRSISGGAYTYLTTVSLSTGYTDLNLSPSTTYRYKVSAIDNAGNESGQSLALSVTTLKVKRH